MLTAILLSELLRVWFFRAPRFPALNLICIAAFAALGCRLPDQNLGNKVLYIASQFVLIAVAIRVGFIRLFPVLHLVVVIRSCFIFGRSGRIITTSLAYLAFLIATLNRLQYRSVVRQFSPLASERFLLLGLMSALFFGLMLVFLQLAVEAVLAERQSREQLAIANTRLRDYALQVEDVAILQERNRIAREIHDSLGHSLTAFNLHLEAALRLLDSDPQEATALLSEAKQLGSTALQEVRQSVSTLRADPLQGQSLADAIARLAADFQRSTGVEPELAIALDRPLTASLKTAAYRLVQEALTNSCKYAEATAVQIAARTQAQHLSLEIADNGRGFERAQTTTGFGLRGMQERTRALNGQWRIDTAPGRGCKISVRLPLA